MKLYKVQEPSL